MTGNIRPAALSDASRIAEMTVINYRINFFPIFKDERYYFGELNVVDTAAGYTGDPKLLKRAFVYDDGAVKGFIRVNDKEVEKLFVEPQFQCMGIGAALLGYAVGRLGADMLWVLEYNKRGIEFYQRHGFVLTGDRIIQDGFVPLIKMTLKK